MTGFASRKNQDISLCTQRKTLASTFAEFVICICEEGIMLGFATRTWLRV